MVTSHEEIRKMIQTEKEKIKEDKISEKVETRKHLVDTVGERGNITPQDCPAWGERCGKRRKKNHFAKVCKQKATTQLHQLEYSEESSSNESTYIIEEEIANVETKERRRVAPILVKRKVVNVSWNVKLTVVHHVR